MAFPSWRRNASASGKARLRSASGPFAATWLTICPSTKALTMTDRVFSYAMRRRLGLTINFEGDLHGHRRLASNLDSRLNTRYTMMSYAWR